MVAAVGSASLPGLKVSVSPAASLEAQLARFQKQLSDCVNCDSANTAQGKKTIQEISNKISEAKARIEQINMRTPFGQAARSDAPSLVAGIQVQNPPRSTDINQPSTPNGARREGGGRVGSLIDVSV